MRCHWLQTAVAAVIATSASADFFAFADETVPPMGGAYQGYKNVIAIPVDDARTRAIAGALIMPEGAGPFPAVVYLPVCGGVFPSPEWAAENRLAEHLKSKGFATLIVDPNSARSEYAGVCSEAMGDRWLEVGKRGAYDALAAVKVLSQRPEIDARHIFLQGRSQGAFNVLAAVDSALPQDYEVKIAGAVAYYPACFDNFRPKVPTLILAAEKDEVTPAADCLAGKDQPNVEVVVYPGTTHGFAWPATISFYGMTFRYDEAATKDAEERVDAFLASHMK